ncbi:MAG: serine/threonine protein kinase [Actinomycetospora sp.]|nr:serine/threonine protein kinase [Actinomycetospora sp.]
MSTPTSVPNALGDGQATIEPGRRVAGRYLLLAPVGRGGSAAVWRAHDELLDRDVAIKRLHGGRALDAARARLVRDRAHREGRVAARLHHPRLAAIFDMVALDGEVCLVMEYVAAPSLADLLEREGPLAPARVAAIGAQIAEGLAAMHERGIVHRDVKPANIMIGADDVVTVTDFGIAVVDTDPAAADHLVAGTPHFMAPELARGGVATAAADVFSLGATLYTALEGRPPTGGGGNALEVLSRVATGVVHPTQRAGHLTPLLQTLLDADPAHRPAAAEAARLLGEAELRSAADPEPRTGPITLAAPAVPAAPPRTRPGTTTGAHAVRGWRPGRRAVAVGAGLVGVLGVAGAAGVLGAPSDVVAPAPAAAPAAGVPLAALPVPVAAPPVIPAAPLSAASPSSRTTAASTPMEEVASESEARRGRAASRQARASWDRLWERWRDQARAGRGGDRDDDRGGDRGRGRGRGNGG